MAGTAASFELRWGRLLSPVPRYSTGKEGPGNHRGEPRHRISGSCTVVIAIVGLGVRLPGILRLSVGFFLRWQSRRDPEEGGVG